MNEEALEELFNIAKKDGYQDTFENFKSLMSSNDKALNTMYELAKDNGYEDDTDNFKALVGFAEKKNQVDTPSDGQEEVTESITETETTPGSSDSLEEQDEAPITPLIQDDSGDSTPFVEFPAVEEEKEIPLTKPANDSIPALKNYEGFIKGSPTADIFTELVEDKTYYLGAKGTGNWTVKDKENVQTSVDSIDCSGTICTIRNAQGSKYDLNYTNARKFKELAKERNIPIESAKDGNLILMNVDGKGIDHIGFVIVDKDGNKFIAESSSSYGGTTITEFDKRVADLKKRKSKFSYEIVSDTKQDEVPVKPLIKDDTELLIPEAPLRSGTLKNEDGSVSTHKMKTETDGQGNWFSFPTVFQNEDGSFVDMSEEAKQNWEPVYEEAKKRGEVIEFGTDEKSASEYGKGSWKPSYDSNKKNKLLLDSGYLAYKEENSGNVLNTIDFDKEGINRNIIPEKEYGFINPETGQKEFKKESELSPELLEAVETYDIATQDVQTPNYLDVDIDEGEVGNANSFLTSVITNDGSDVTDYLKWEKKNTRNETGVYKWAKGLLTDDEGDEYFEQKNYYEKVQSYKTAQLNQISKRLNQIQAKIDLTSDTKQIKELKNEGKELSKEFYAKVESISTTIKDFPVLTKYTEDTDLRRRKAMYEAAQEGGADEGGQGLVELLAVAGNSLAGFGLDFLASIPAFLDQRIATIGKGDDKFDNKGVLKSLEEMLTQSKESLEITTGAVKRSAFLDGKPVLSLGKQYIVDENGTVYDANTNIRMDGIISPEKIKEIQTLSKDVTETVTNWTAGSVTQGGVGMLVHLYGLIRTSGKVTKKLGFKGPKGAGLGMGITSFASGITGNVEDVRSQLVASGMSEKEAMNIAVNAGQAISTLDGIFSGLAGGNQKLLTGFTGIKDQIKNLALKEGKKFTAKQLVDKGKGLLKENAKELFIEELPVYFSEKGINHLVNRHIGNEVLSDKITKAGIMETVVMTVGATSGLGAKNLLSGNRRSNLVRLAAANVKNLQSTLDVLVKEGSLTEKESSDAYTEIYNMQSAELKTQGTIKVSENLQPASDLLTQRQNLINKKQGLEGPGKARIDKQIAAVDQQLDALYKKDELQVQEELTKQKEDDTSSSYRSPEEIKYSKKYTDLDVLAALKEEGIESPTEQQIQEKTIFLEELRKERLAEATAEREAQDKRVENYYKTPEVMQSLKEEGIESPTEQQIQKKYNELLKTKEDAISKPSTEEQVLPDAPTSKKEGRDSEVELQQVGEGDVEQVTPDTQVQEGETQTDKPSDTTTETDVEQLTEPTSTKEGMSVNNQIESFANRIVEGGNQESFSEDAIQFYAENKEAIDNAVSQKKKQQPKTQSKERALALKIARGDTEFSNAEIDLYAKSEGAVKAEVDAIGKTNSQTVTANTYKSIIASTKIKGKPKTIKVKSDYSAMKKDLQKEARVARNAKNDVNKRRKGLQGAIDLVLKAGNITTKKANSLLKKVSNVNLYNAKKVQDVIDFTTRAMNDAEYSNKLDKAKKLQASIKKKLKGKEAGLSEAAKKFTQVNPSNVNDIDTYLEKASEISNGLTPTRKPSKGELKVSKPFDIKKIEEYSKKETELEAERNYELAKESFQELTGLEPGDLTLDQMKEILYEVDGSTNTSETDAQTLKDKKNAIDKAANNAFKNTKINIKGAIESGDIKVTKTQKTLINNFLNMDLSLMTTKQKLEALDSIVNFELNQSTGGMEASLMQQVGNTKITRLKNKGVKNTENKSLFGLGKFWNKQISTLPNVFELTFKSQQKARMVMEALGLDGIINGSAKAQKESANTEKDYADKFAKKKMQDGIYFDESNDTERGILADVRRFTPGTESEQQKEFEKSKKLIEQTYERLMASGDKLKVKKGEIVKAQYDKLLKDSNSIADVESKADPANLDGVKYVTEIWAKKYNELADTSLNVYNKNLGKDTNYTPRNIQKVKQPKAEDVDITQPVFNPEGNKRKSAYDKKTGVLKEATKPGSLETGDVLNLSFDAQNMSNYKAALTDIYTAPSIQQVKGARESKAFNEVFTNESAKEIINDRINSYVDSKRGKKYVDGSTKRTLNRINKVATLGVSRVLGGPTQFVKQIVPIFNTMFNAGLSNTLKGSKLIFDAEVQKAIDNSGLPIANRGIQSQSDIENADSRIKKKAQTKGGRVIDAADNINKKTLEAFLVYPDVQTARASFIAYYVQQVKKDGGDTTNIDWSKPLDKKAAQYAQQQVDRQQNTSDQDLQGDLFTDQRFYPQIVRKTLFPFANFLLNQKTRMYSDINTLINNPTALPGDKTRALKSLGGLGVETVMFNAIGLGITQTLAAAARLISGEEEDPNLNRYANKRAREEKREKEFNQRLIGRTGNALADILVPIPILNDESLNQINGLMSMFQDDEDNPFQFFAKTDKKIIDQLGTLGIGAKKAVILADMIKTIVTGEKTTVFMGRESKAEIDPEKLNALKMTTMAYAMHLIGVPVLNSSEVGYIAERAFKDIGKSREIEEKVDYIVEAEAVLNQRGIKNPSQKMIDNEAKQLKRIDQGKDRKVEKTNSKSKDDKSFSPASFGNEKGKKKSGKSFNPKSF